MEAQNKLINSSYVFSTIDFFAEDWIRVIPGEDEIYQML